MSSLTILIINSISCNHNSLNRQYKNLASLLRNIGQWRCKQRIKRKRGLERNFLVYLLCILLYLTQYTTIGDEDQKNNVTES